ncbi:MAG: hypothetical protein GKS03_07610 [Alphaproteobacteria bacterium]|nr:hypothetical protein [Alphaproteobacteria bacterium]
MGLSARHIITVSALLSLGGCSFATDALFPVFGEDEAPAAPPAPVASSSAPSSEFRPAPVAASAGQFGLTAMDTGTFVNQKVGQFNSELNQLRGTLSVRNNQLESIRSQTVGNASTYHGMVGGIKSRLQVGTTPGNPQLMSQWRSSQEQLNRIEGDISNMNQLAAQVAADSAMSSYLLDSVRAAYSLTGAVDDDHRRLRGLEDEVNQTTVTIERLLNELTTDIGRQQQFVASERENLMELAGDINSGQLYGSQQTSNTSPQMASAAPGDFSQRRPLVVIRFDRQDVAYEPALYQAVSRALERRPDAVFDLVAVSPGTGNQNLSSGSARRNAEQVLGSLAGMGLPSDRVMLSAMASPTAQSSEVHIYVR